jgi:hypothetical protein
MLKYIPDATVDSSSIYTVSLIAAFIALIPLGVSTFAVPFCYPNTRAFTESKRIKILFESEDALFLPKVTGS